MNKKKAETVISKSQGTRHRPKKTGSAPKLSRIIAKNIQSIIAHREEVERKRTVAERAADKITDFSGRILFVVLHLLWFAAWFLLNSGWFGLRPFDPFPYGLLTMIVSLEAIFLSTFVLISQNRMSEMDQQRAELDLQINLLTEHELTRVLQMLDKIQNHLGIDDENDGELSELEKETKPSDVLKEIEDEERKKKERRVSVYPE